MARTFGILLFHEAEELDFVGPLEVFGATGKRNGEDRVVTIAETKEPIVCANGMRVVPDCSFDDAPRLDVILVPGGMGTRTEVGNAALVDWLRKAGESCEWVTSVCTGALLLHEAGFARGRRVTTHWAFADELAKRPEISVEKDVRYVRDGNLVTAAGVSAGIDMSLWLVGQLYGPAFARDIQRWIEYDPSPPYAADV